MVSFLHVAVQLVHRRRQAPNLPPQANKPLNEVLALAPVKLKPRRMTPRTDRIQGSGFEASFKILSKQDLAANGVVAFAATHGCLVLCVWRCDKMFWFLGCCHEWLPRGVTQHHPV